MSQEWFDNGSNATSTSSGDYRVYDKLVEPTTVGTTTDFSAKKVNSTISEIDAQLRQEWDSCLIPVRLFGMSTYARPSNVYSSASYPIIIDFYPAGMSQFTYCSDYFFETYTTANIAGNYYRTVNNTSYAQSSLRIYLGGTLVTAKDTLGSTYNGQTDRYFWRGNGNIRIEYADFSTTSWTSYWYQKSGTAYNVINDTSLSYTIANICTPIGNYAISEGYASSSSDRLTIGKINQIILENLVIGEPCMYGLESNRNSDFEDFLEDYVYGAYAYTTTQKERLSYYSYHDINCTYLGTNKVNGITLSDVSDLNTNSAIGSGVNKASNSQTAIMFAVDGLVIPITFSNNYNAGSCRLNGYTGGITAMPVFNARNYCVYIDCLGRTFWSYFLKYIGKIKCSDMGETYYNEMISRYESNITMLPLIGTPFNPNSSSVTFKGVTTVLDETDTWENCTGLGGAGFPDPLVADYWATKSGAFSSISEVRLSSQPHFPLWISADADCKLYVGYKDGVITAFAVEVAHSQTSGISYDTSGGARRFVLVITDKNYEQLIRRYGYTIITAFTTLSITN